MTVIRKILPSDISQLKTIADANRDALSFLTRGKFKDAAEQKRGLVAIHNNHIIGFVLFRHRQRDQQTTLSEICVDEQYRGKDIGRTLVDSLISDCQQKGREFIQLKCPTDLPANEFYSSVGFHLHAVESGKKRKLNVWRLDIT